MNQTLQVPDTDIKLIEEKFNNLNSNRFNVGNSSASDRKKKLGLLHKTILKYRDDIRKAMLSDFGKHPSEVDMTEIYPITSEIKHVKSHLGEWMLTKKVRTPLALMGSSSFIKYESKGIVLIISPWNFPFNLTFCPLISAIAAGNTVILKPSEHTPHSSRLMKIIVEEVFQENEVSLIEGGIKTSTKLLSLPFNHIFFTGAPSIGKIVMKAAAEHLTSVTLELGGKSPTIIDKSADIDTAARRIAWGKFVNNGQVCIAPDYVLIHESLKSQFLKKIKEYIIQFYTKDASQEKSYSRIVNSKHYNRIKSLINDSLSKGAKLELGNNTIDKEDYISPTIISNVDANSLLMTEEIFGPVLPVNTFMNIDEAISFVNSKEKPLALYIYSKNKANIKKVINNTRAGGGCINHNAVHFYNSHLPFGGSNNSGIGKGHGIEGFKSFSNARGILKQNIPNALEMLLPPYNDFKQKLIDLTIKWF